jgi:hypothetical protein
MDERENVSKKQRRKRTKKMVSKVYINEDGEMGKLFVCTIAACGR